MVQMKGSNSTGRLTVFVFLYIPHGSDESYKEITEKLHLKFFISHMVQMKETFKSLRPGSDFDLYIPHGSDESLTNEVTKKLKE